MKRVTKILSAGAVDAGQAVDRVVLDADERHRRRIVLTAEQGTRVLLDLPTAIKLQNGDGLVLEDGSIVLVVARPEALMEISAASEAERLRLAWHLGNRHTDVQVVGQRLRIRRDHVLEEMMRGLGAVVTDIDAPFEPEGGAYAQAHGAQGHAHHHDREDEQ